MLQLVLLFFRPAALWLLLGCLAAALPYVVWAAPQKLASKKQRVLPDATIEQALRARLARSEKISRNGFQVRVQNGVAYLTGRTDVIQHKGAATRMAKAAGARSVANQILVTEAARQRAAASLAKSRQRASLKQQRPGQPAVRRAQLKP